jgi:hypothetical protein
MSYVLRTMDGRDIELKNVATVHEHGNVRIEPRAIFMGPKRGEPSMVDIAIQGDELPESIVPSEPSGFSVSVTRREPKPNEPSTTSDGRAITYYRLAASATASLQPAPSAGQTIQLVMRGLRGRDRTFNIPVMTAKTPTVDVIPSQVILGFVEQVSIKKLSFTIDCQNCEELAVETVQASAFATATFDKSAWLDACKNSLEVSLSFNTLPERDALLRLAIAGKCGEQPFEVTVPCVVLPRPKVAESLPAQQAKR